MKKIARKEMQRKVIKLTGILRTMSGMEDTYSALWNERAEIVRFLKAKNK